MEVVHFLGPQWLVLVIVPLSLLVHTATWCFPSVSCSGFYRSICTRDGIEHEALEKLGHLISVVHVDGFLMFGSTPAFTDAVAGRIGLVGGGLEFTRLSMIGMSFFGDPITKHEKLWRSGRKHGQDRVSK